MSLSRGLPQVTRADSVLLWFDGASVGPHAGRTGPGHSPCGGGRRVDGTQPPSVPEAADAGEIRTVADLKGAAPRACAARTPTECSAEARLDEVDRPRVRRLAGRPAIARSSVEALVLR